MSLTLKQFAAKGGRARAAKLSQERRIEIARNAGLASAKRHKVINADGSSRYIPTREHTSKRNSCQSDQNGETK